MTRREQAIELNNQVIGAVTTDPQLAYRLLCSATTVDPTMAHGWYGLGNATGDLKMLDASIAAFRRVLELPEGTEAGDLTPSMRAEAMVRMSHRLQEAGRVHEAGRWAEQAIRRIEDLNPEIKAFALINRSLIFSVLGYVENSLMDAEAAYKISESPIIRLGYAFALLYAGQYSRGLHFFEARFPYKLTRYLNYPYPRWEGGRVGRLFIDCDQGLGDTLSFSRFIPHAASRVEQLVFAVQPELLRLLRGALAPYSNVEVIPQSTIFPLADAWCPVMSLASGQDDVSLAGMEGLTLPFSEVSDGEWRAPGRRLHIGIAFAGSPLNETDRWRSIAVTEMLRLYEVPGVQLYSLQVGDRVADVHAAGAASLIRDLSPWIRDATDAAAMIRELDLVITVESFVGHLCGALGVACWVLVSARGGDWRLGRTGDKSVWYPRHRLFRQDATMEWGPVMDRVIEALQERM